MGFNAVQPFGIDSDIQLSRKVLIAALTLMRCMQIALAKSYYLPVTREMGGSK